MFERAVADGSTFIAQVRATNRAGQSTTVSSQEYTVSLGNLRWTTTPVLATALSGSSTKAGFSPSRTSLALNWALETDEATEYWVDLESHMTGAGVLLSRHFESRSEAMLTGLDLHDGSTYTATGILCHFIRCLE